ncbi:MAG: hypothetical protein ACRDT8_03315, partial [Micromonosporaceae bacterium]
MIEILKQGGPAQRKPLCDALVHELRIIGNSTAQPTFRVPLASAPQPENGFHHPTVTDEGVRALPRLVG